MIVFHPKETDIGYSFKATNFDLIYITAADYLMTKEAIAVFF